jgi:DNA-binding transcriptional ArsR family regulator
MVIKQVPFTLMLPSSPALPLEKIERVAALFKVLGEPMRLKILQCLCAGPRAVTQIVEATHATQANVSKHLSLLVHAGVLHRRREGQRVFYGMRDELVPRLCEVVCGNLA